MAEETFVSFYLRSNTIRVFNAAVRKIGQPRFIRFMINPDTMQLAMLPAVKKDFQSFRVPKGLYSSHVGNDAMQVHSQKLVALWHFNWVGNLTGHTVFREKYLKNSKLPGLIYVAHL